MSVSPIRLSLFVLVVLTPAVCSSLQKRPASVSWLSVLGPNVVTANDQNEKFTVHVQKRLHWEIYSFFSKKKIKSVCLGMMCDRQCCVSGQLIVVSPIFTLLFSSVLVSDTNWVLWLFCVCWMWKQATATGNANQFATTCLAFYTC